MANHKSAIKRHRQSLKRRDRNRTARANVRSAIKKVRAAAQEGNQKAATAAFAEAEGIIARAGGKRLLHRKNASRKISRLAALVNKTGTPKAAHKPSARKAK